MDDTERRSVKRSRFDQTEPEPRRSRFDRRSRSPPARKPDSGRDRERSPLSRPRDTPADSKSPPVDPAAAAGKLSFAQPAHSLDPRHIHFIVARANTGFQPLPPPGSMRNSRPARASSMSMSPRSARAPSRATTPRQAPVPAPSTAKSTSRMAITSRTSRSTTCATATSSQRARLRKW